MTGIQQIHKLTIKAISIHAPGAFHEDGFAGACDGFGGGWDKAQVLAIMKDSRIGSYGTIGMVLMLLAKAAALVELAEPAALAPLAGSATSVLPADPMSPGVGVALALLVAHPLSRLAATVVMHRLPYVRADDSAKSAAVARPLAPAELALAAACGLIPLLLLPPASPLGALLAAAAVTVWTARLFRRQLGGYTGDLLGRHHRHHRRQRRRLRQADADAGRRRGAGRPVQAQPAGAGRRRPPRRRGPGAESGRNLVITRGEVYAIRAGHATHCAPCSRPS